MSKKIRTFSHMRGEIIHRSVSKMQVLISSQQLRFVFVMKITNLNSSIMSFGSLHFQVQLFKAKGAWKQNSS